MTAPGDVRATRATVTQVEIIGVGELERASFLSLCWAWPGLSALSHFLCLALVLFFSSQLYPLRRWELLCPLPRSVLSWLDFFLKNQISYRKLTNLCSF